MIKVRIKIDGVGDMELEGEVDDVLESAARLLDLLKIKIALTKKEETK